MIDCPDTDKLRQLLDEQLSQEAYRDLEAHLEACSRCREALDRLTAGAAAVFRSRLGPAPCLLAALDRADEQRLSTHLPPDTSKRLTSPSPEGPLTSTAAPLMPAPAPAQPIVRVAGRNVLLGAIGQGGMGRVFEGRDPDLGRPLAVKVLLDCHRGSPEMVRRFRDEVQIHAQLQHPGVVPVYELGELPDGCPFFTMKLVQGQTLSELLSQRGCPQEDLLRFLTICEQIAQTLAHAHSRGVIHRDLKPSNVMVGPFGEVQVMDWGLAKVLPRKGEATAHASQPDGDTAGLIYAVRTVDLSRGGLGTLGFMPPEQANGRVDEVDERADVFGLGGILCDILTGQPPYAGHDFDEVLRLTRRGDVTGAFARLDSCGADADLVSLCKECLATDRLDRPRHAGVVAERMVAYQAGVRERLRAAELERAAAQARARAERRARRLTVGMAAALLGLLVVAGGAGVWFQWQRAELRQGTAAALVRQTELREAGRWQEARTVLEQAQARLGATGPADLRQQVQQDLNGLDLLERLDAVRLRKMTIVEGQFDYASADRDYAREFQAVGLARMDEDAAVVANRIRASPLRVQLINFLDDWADTAPEEGRRTWLLRVACQVDADEWRNQFRDPALWNNPQALKQRLEGVDVAKLSTHLLVALARHLPATDTVAFLTEAQQRKPDDFWLNFKLGNAVAKARPAKAEGYYRAALALRPRIVAVYNNLGVALYDLKDLDGAIAQYRKALEIDPNYAQAHNNLGNALRAKGDRDGAIARYRKALELDPNFAQAHNNLGVTLYDLKDLDGAIAQYQKALELDPVLAQAHYNLGIALYDKKDLDGAIARFQKALELDPKFAQARHSLGEALRAKGNTLYDKKDWDGAIAQYRKGIEVDPKNAHIHHSLGNALLLKGDPEAAIPEYKTVIELNPKNAHAHGDLGGALRARGRFADALAAFRRFQELASQHPELKNLAETRVRETEQLLELDAKLAAVLRGEVKPTATEHVGFAVLCQQYKRLYGASGHFYQEAFAAQPQLVEATTAYSHRYHAACAAALAGCGQGEDSAKLDEKERTRWRQQALDWLRADLTFWARHVNGSTPKDQALAREALRHWQRDPDLAGVHDEPALARLPEAERQIWVQFWSEVAALLEQPPRDK